MTVAGTLTVTVSDDPRFKVGDTIGLVIDPSATLSVTQTVEVSAPTPDPLPAAEVSGTVGTTATETTAAEGENPKSTPPATV